MSERKLSAYLGLAEVFGRDMSPEGASLALRVLSFIPDDDFELICLRLAGSQTFMPKPKEIIEEYRQTQPAAMLAYEKALLAASKCGAYRVPRFKDPLVSHVIKQLGGWPSWCSTKSGCPFTRDRFLQIYSDLSEMQNKEAIAPAPLGAIGHKSRGSSTVGELLGQRLNSIGIEHNKQEANRE